MKLKIFRKKQKEEKEESVQLGEKKADSTIEPTVESISSAKPTEAALKKQHEISKQILLAEQKKRDEAISKHLSKKLHKLGGLKDKKLFAKKKKIEFNIRGFVKNINLTDQLEKAGLENLDAKKVAASIFRIDVIICIVLTALILLMGVTSGKNIWIAIRFVVGFWLTLFLLFLGLIWLGYLFYLDMKIFNRTRAVEDVFPDFLQLTSANISAGMPIDKALWYAVRPNFGVLAKEIEQVAKNTMAGEDLAVALTTFANKYDSKVIQRSVNLLLEGMSAGGKMADLLSKIAIDIDETKLLKKEMAANVTTYVIFITFATIVAAPVLFALSTQLLIIIKGITANMGPTTSSSSSFFSLSFSSNSVKTSDFKIFSYLMLSVSAFFSACIASTIKKGRVKEGLSKIPVFIAVSLLIYTLASLLIQGLFKNML